MTTLGIPTPRRFPAAIAAAIAAAMIALFALGWVLHIAPSGRDRIIRWAMIGGYALAASALLYRAHRYRQERKGWNLLGFAIVVAALTSLLLQTGNGDYHSISPMEVIGVVLLTTLAAVCTIWGFLAWPQHHRPRTLNERTLLNGLGGLFMGASLWLLFWMSGTWYERFQGHTAHHIHLIHLGALMASAGGVAAFLFLECPRRGRGPIGVILVGLTLLTAAFGLLSIGFDSPGYHPGFALLPGFPLVYALAAIRNAPVEPSVGLHQPPNPDLPEILPFFPFLALGPVVALALWREGGSLLWPVTSLLAITGILILRQILLLRELTSANRNLEARVLERTQALMDLQDRQIRQERMNTLAMLGAGMIHDMNNALGVVLGSVELARLESSHKSPTMQRYLDRIHLATEQLAGLSQRVMTFARREIEDPYLINLVEEVHQVEPMLHMLLPSDVRLSIEVIDEPPKVLASRGLIEQSLVNLVANARDAMPKGGEIRVRLEAFREPAPKATLSISDTGPGIPKHIRERLFTPFFTTKPAGRGTGLGLASTKTIIEEVGGEIFMRSIEGQGTTFTLIFPVPTQDPIGNP